MASHLHGTTKSRFTRMNRPPDGSSWCWFTAEMLGSPAWRALTGNALKIVLRIALEHLKHGGIENGKLPVTYQDFVRAGIRKNSIREALAVAEQLGMIERTSVGEVPWHGDIRAPSTYGLTWLPRYDGAPPSNRWKQIETDAEAKAKIRQAKTQVAALRQLSPTFNRQKRQSPTRKHATCAGNAPDTCSGLDSRLSDSPRPTNPSNDSSTTIYISGYPRHDSPAHTTPGKVDSARYDATAKTPVSANRTANPSTTRTKVSRSALQTEQVDGDD
jgi:hypothetical protein